MASADLVVRIITDTSRAKGLDETGSKTGKFSRGIAAASKVAAGALLVVGGAAIKAGRAAAEDAQSQAILAKSMQNSAGASKSQIAATEDWIAKMALATGVADDQLRPALGTLVRATGDTEKSQKALSTALDISAATGKDVESVSSALAKGYAGNTSAIGRLVPGLDKATVASGDMNKIMGELSKKTKGSAAAAADTAAGKMQRMQVAMDEATESAGTALLPAMGMLATVMGKAAGFAQEHSRAVQILAAVIAGLALAVLAVNAALKVYQATLVVVQAVQKATWLSNPIFLVVAAVIALGAAIVIAYRKSATFRRIVNALWAGIKAGARAVANFVRAVFNVLWRVVGLYVRTYATIVRTAFRVIMAVARAVASALRAVWRGVWDALKAGARAVRDAIGAAFQAVRTKVGTIVAGVKSAWSGVWSTLKTGAKTAGDALSGPFNTVKTAIDKVIDAVQSLIDWLGRIKVPKISLPKIPGLGRSAPAAAAAPGVTTYTAPTGRAAVGGRASVTASGGGGVTINVNGALDPEAVARQIQRLMGGHVRRMGGAAA